MMKETGHQTVGGSANGPIGLRPGGERKRDLKDHEGTGTNRRGNRIHAGSPQAHKTTMRDPELPTKDVLVKVLGCLGHHTS